MVQVGAAGDDTAVLCVQLRCNAYAGVVTGVEVKHLVAVQIGRVNRLHIVAVGMGLQNENVLAVASGIELLLTGAYVFVGFGCIAASVLSPEIT